MKPTHQIEVPPDIVEAAGKILAWAATNGLHEWQIAGVCDRRIADRLDQAKKEIRVLHDIAAKLLTRFRDSGQAQRCEFCNELPLTERERKRMKELHFELCPRHGCFGLMKPGIATGQTYTAGTPDFPGQTYTAGQTISPGGPGSVINCLKCDECGHSITKKPGTASP